MMYIKFHDIVILIMQGVDYCSVINTISKSETVNVLQSADLTKR